MTSPEKTKKKDFDSSAPMGTKSVNLMTSPRRPKELAEPPSPLSYAGILARHAYKADDEAPRNNHKVHPTNKTQGQLVREGSNRKFSFGKFGFFGRRSGGKGETSDERQRRAQLVVQQTQTSVGVKVDDDNNAPSSGGCDARKFQRNDNTSKNSNVNEVDVSSLHVSSETPWAGPTLLAPRDPADKRLTLVLDLDETLVRTSFDPAFDFDFEAPFELNGCWCTARVRKRPFVDEFLQRVSQDFELILMTAGVEPYASRVLDVLDGGRVLDYRFYRDSCTKTDAGLLVKDLSRFNRDLERTIIVDNSPNAYMWHPQNAIDVDDFVGDDRDRQLLAVADFLHVIKDAADVRSHLPHWQRGKHYAASYDQAATGPALDRRENGANFRSPRTSKTKTKPRTEDAARRPSKKER